jgi:hypothetical protein
MGEVAGRSDRLTSVKQCDHSWLTGSRWLAPFKVGALEQRERQPAGVVRPGDGLSGEHAPT